MPNSSKPMWLEWTVISLIHVMLVVTTRLPIRWSRALGRFVGAGLYRFNRRMRWVAIRNLELTYPQWSEEQRVKVAKRSVQATGELMAEMGRLWAQPWERTESMIEFDGLECVIAPIKEGRGVIVLGPHLGNWELLGMYLATIGDLVALYEPLAFKKLDRLVHHGRQQTGAQLVPTTPRGIAKLVQSVRSGGITGILPDQVPASENAGVNASFYGVPCFTASLASNLIKKSGATPVTGAMLRTRSGFRGVFRPAEPAVVSDDTVEALTAINLSVQKLIEGNESQYQWQYKRFRCRPSEGFNPYDWASFPVGSSLGGLDDALHR